MNGRRARARRRQEKILRQSQSEPTEFVCSGPGFDVLRTGSVASVVPTISEDLPHALKQALAIRREAQLKGRCRCGARIRILRPGYGVMEHEPECVAVSVELHEALTSRGKRTR